MTQASIGATTSVDARRLLVVDRRQDQPLTRRWWRRSCSRISASRQPPTTRRPIARTHPPRSGGRSGGLAPTGVAEPTIGPGYRALAAARAAGAVGETAASACVTGRSRPIHPPRWPTMPSAASPPKSPLRAWQVSALERLEGWNGGPFLISAAPGAGKTRPAFELARRLFAARTVDARRRRLPDDAADPPVGGRAAGRLGVHLAPDARGPRPPTDFDGVAVTYARVASNPAALGAGITPRTARDRRRGPPPRRGARVGHGVRSDVPRRTDRWLLLSGTPFRSDATPIPGVRYDRGRLRRSPTSPTPTPRPSATASAGRSASSPTTGRSRGAAATT